jgi:hypothetical protein
VRWPRPGPLPLTAVVEASETERSSALTKPDGGCERPPPARRIGAPLHALTSPQMWMRYESDAAGGGPAATQAPQGQPTLSMHLSTYLSQSAQGSFISLRSTSTMAPVGGGGSLRVWSIVYVSGRLCM